MDQGPLVKEQIDAGAQLIQEFNKYAPVQSAFWLKEIEDGQWFLYLVSDRINDSNFDHAYAEVLRIAGKGPHLWLDPFQVKVTGVDDPLAKGMIGIQRQNPGRLPLRLRTCRVGDLTLEEIYVYPLPTPAPV